MTKLKESGETNNIKVNIEDFDKLKSGDGVSVGDKTKYEYGADLHTDGAPLIDPAYGKTISIRVFEFKMNPDPVVRKHFPTDRQVIFNAHAKQISTILWGDGLVPIDEVGPRVIINRKKALYQIFVPCTARFNTSFFDKPKALTEHLHKK